MNRKEEVEELQETDLDAQKKKDNLNDEVRYTTYSTGSSKNTGS